MNFMLIYWRRKKGPERRKYPQRAAARMAPHLSSKSGDQAKPASSTCHCLLTGFVLFENWKYFSYFDHWCSNRLPSSPCFLGSTALCLRAILTAGKFLVMHLNLLSSVTRWENHCCGVYNLLQYWLLAWSGRTKTSLWTFSSLLAARKSLHAVLL